MKNEKLFFSMAIPHACMRSGHNLLKDHEAWKAETRPVDIQIASLNSQCIAINLLQFMTNILHVLLLDRHLPTTLTNQRGEIEQIKFTTTLTLSKMLEKYKNMLTKQETRFLQVYLRKSNIPCFYILPKLHKIQ